MVALSSDWADPGESGRSAGTAGAALTGTAGAAPDAPPAARYRKGHGGSSSSPPHIVHRMSRSAFCTLHSARQPGGQPGGRGAAGGGPAPRPGFSRAQPGACPAVTKGVDGFSRRSLRMRRTHPLPLFCRIRSKSHA